MSLEQVIQENTNAVRELISALKNIPALTGAPQLAGTFNKPLVSEAVVEAAKKPQEPEVPTSATPEAAPSVASTPSTAVAEAVAAPESKPEPSATTTQEPAKAERTYTRDEFVRVVKEYAGSEADKSKIANLLAIAGTQTFRDVPEDKFAAVINAIPAAVVESVLKGA